MQPTEACFTGERPLRAVGSSTVKTTCPYCGVGCGVDCGVSVSTTDEQIITVAGDVTHPANRGNLCLKGQTLAETISPDGRLLYPTAYGERCSWNNATQLIAEKFKQTIEQHGPDSVAFYVSGQLLTEDYYVVNKFVKGYLGTANIDTNSRLCMASSVAGHKRAFGSDTVPGCYEDLELADLVVLVGSNLAWCHPVLFNRLEAARQSNPDLKVINIDPRRTATADLADDHLTIKPDSDTALFGGLLQWLETTGYADHAYIDSATNGVNEALAATRLLEVEVVAEYTGLSVDAIQAFYKKFAATSRVVTVYSQGVNQSVAGTDKVNAIINCHLYTGRIGKPGCGPFSITGQPNAMGGRETGGLANTLTCHMELNNPDHRRIVKNYWQSPSIADKPGLTAVELFNAIHEGQVKALWIMATNPLVSLPDSNFVAQALGKCEFVVQSDVVSNNDTSAYAHVHLPAQAWGEKEGTVTNSERCISRQRRFLSPPGEAMPDWWAVSQVAALLGYKNSFNYTAAHEIFAEYAKLSGLENSASRDFDISAFSGIDKITYENLTPFYWPATSKAPSSPIRFFSKGDFFTDDRRANFIVTKPVQKAHRQSTTTTTTLALNSGRSRDQWHTMTRTGLAHTLANHTAEPFVQIHPADARRLKLNTADLATVSNQYGHSHLRVVITDTVAQGSVFIPMHWCHPFASNGKVNALTKRVTDPVSKQPALKSGEITLKKLQIAQFGFAVSATPIDTDQLDYFAKARCDGGWRYEFALLQPTGLQTIASDLISEIGTDCVEYHSHTGRYCHFSFTGNALSTALVVDNNPVVADRNWLCAQLTRQHNPDNRADLLAAIKPRAHDDTGELICNCMEVGSKQIEAAIKLHDCRSVLEVSKHTLAGINCGSCRSDIAAILKRLAVPEVA